MDLTTYVERLRDEAGEATVRLMLLDALSAAADEITRELAPATVEVRLRGGEPEFVVTPVPADEPAPEMAPPPEGETARINLRLPEQLKAGVEQAATREGLSVNSWLVRAVAAALTNRAPGRPPQRGGRIGESFTGWVR
jgi:hypothetical protein